MKKIPPLRFLALAALLSVALAVPIGRADTIISGTVNRNRRTLSIVRVPGGLWYHVLADVVRGDGHIVETETWRVRISDRHVFDSNGADTGLVFPAGAATSIVTNFTNLDQLFEDLKTSSKIPAPQ